MSEWQMDGFPDEMLYQARGITSNSLFAQAKTLAKNGVGEAGPREVDTYLHNPLPPYPDASGQRRGHHVRPPSTCPASQTVGAISGGVHAREPENFTSDPARQKERRGR